MSEKMEKKTEEHPYLCACPRCEKERRDAFWGWNQHVDPVRTATGTAAQNVVNQPDDYSF